MRWDESLIDRARREAGAFPGQFWLLTLGMFVYLTGVESAYPFETLYLTGRLGVSMSAVGLILGLTVFAGLPFQIVGGALTDRLGRRPVLALGVAGSAALYLALGLVHDLTQLVAFIAWEAALGWPMFLTASNAMIADLTPFERRTEAFGITRVAVNAGMVVGPLLAGAVLVVDPTFRSSFLLGGTICCAFLVVIALGLKETRPVAVERRREPLGGYGVVLRDRRLLLFCLVALLPLYGFGQIWSIFPVALEKAQGTAPESWSRLLALYALSGTLLQYPVVRLVRRRDSMLLMACASLLIGVGLGGAVLVPFGWATRGLFVAVSLGVMLLHPHLDDGGVAARSGRPERSLHGRLDAGVARRLRAGTALRRHGDRHAGAEGSLRARRADGARRGGAVPASAGTAPPRRARGGDGRPAGGRSGGGGAAGALEPRDESGHAHRSR